MGPAIPEGTATISDHSGGDRRPGRAWIRAAQVIVVALALVLPPSPAWALPAERPDDTWQVNGPVRALLKVGTVIFLGGDFTELRENPIGQGGRVIDVDNFAALNAATGAPIPQMEINPPNFTGDGDIVHALTLAGGKVWVGGRFKAVDGAARHNLAAIDPGTLSVESPNPRVGGMVFALDSNATRVYAGGKFRKVNGQPRDRLAALSLTGALDAVWTPSVNDRVVDMAVTSDGTGLFVTGDFKSASDSDGSSKARNSLAEFSISTGNVTPWIPGGSPYSLLIRGTGVTTTEDRLYWATAGSDWVAAFDIDTENRIFKTETDGTVNEAVEMGDRVIIGGHFLLVGPQPGGPGCASHPEACDPHTRIAALNLNGVLDQSWNPKLQGEWQGAKRFLVDGSNLWIAGVFTKITGVPQNYVGRLS
jgi:hypothetical protein